MQHHHTMLAHSVTTHSAAVQEFGDNTNSRVRFAEDAASENCDECWQQQAAGFEYAPCTVRAMDKLTNHPMRVMIDSGSALNLVTTAALNVLRRKATEHQKPLIVQPMKQIRIHSASGHTLTAEGTVWLNQLMLFWVFQR
eukprot:GHVQ01039257.1.p1 GENE.GHVQ01039257.1~~GHVQ01039257.1.p1  ORF type:complete len:140 (-),score=10.17 GHVQ01039257.1:21-440(-)